MSLMNVRAFAPMKQMPTKVKEVKKVLVAAGGGGDDKPPINNKLPKLNYMKNDLTKLTKFFKEHQINQDLKSIFKNFNKIKK